MYVAPIAEFLTDLGLAPALSKAIAIALIVFALALVCLLIYMIIKLVSKIISIKAKTSTVKSIIKFSEEQKFSGKLAFFLIALFLSRVVSISPFLSKYLSKLPIYVIIFTFIVVINCILNIAGDVYSTRTIAKKRPIKGLIQVIKIVLYIIFAMIVISLMIGQSPMVLIGGIRTFTAILSIVFKDALLGLVAGVQITADDLLRIGDWVDIPSAQVEGTVQDISLISVKILGFDNTIYTVPAYTFLSSSFKNWHTAINGKARRVLRTIPVDVTSIKTLDEAEIKKINGRYKGLDIKQGATNLTAYTEILKRELINCEHIIKSRGIICQISDKMTGAGIPVEFIAFTDQTEWGDYSKTSIALLEKAVVLANENGIKLYQTISAASQKAQ